MQSALEGPLDDDLETALNGYLRSERESLHSRLDRHRDSRSGRRDEPKLDSYTWRTLVDAVERTDIHAAEAGFRKRFKDLDREIRVEPRRYEIRETVDRILLCGFVVRDDAEAGPSPNVMALAQRILDLFLTPAVGFDWNSDSKARSKPDYFDLGLNEKSDDFKLRASYLLNALKPLFGAEIEPVRQEVQRWETLAGSEGLNETSAHYVSILAHAQQAFRDFAAPAPAWTLYFGIEPYWKRLAAERSSRIVDFAQAVDADEGLTVWVIQPNLSGDRDTLVVKAMKAAFFEVRPWQRGTRCREEKTVGGLCGG